MTDDGVAENLSRPNVESVWAESAVPAPELPRLCEDISTEVVVIGAGFTGLNAARELTRRGVDCLILEANDAGWGASGRNGGMAVLRYKKFWSALATEYGNDATVAMHRWIHEGLDTLEQNVEELGIDCGFRRCGHITAAHGKRALRALEADCRWLASHAKDSTPRTFGAEDARELMGTDGYSGGYLDPRAAAIHPLNYSRGFAAALQRRGIRIYQASPVTSISAQGAYLILRTPGGIVRARKAIACTNAYSGLFDLGTDLSKRMLSISAAVVATEPLSPEAVRPILPMGHIVTDTRQLVNYFRLTPGNRILFGGRGSLFGREEPRYYEELVNGLHRTYPHLREVRISHRWCGRVGVTLDHFPHVGNIGDRLFYAVGCGGRGVVLSNLLGKYVVRRALGAPSALGPMSETKFRAIRFGHLRAPVLQSMAAYYRLRDHFAI